MKNLPIAQTVADYRKSAWIPLAVACGWLALADRPEAAELLTNRQFDQVLVDWTVPQDLEPWIPYKHPAGTVSLNPSVGDYMGTLLGQPLNVTGIAGQTVTGSIDLGAEWALSEGNTFVVYATYLDDTGAKHREALIRPANTAIPAGSMATFTGNFTFPTNAAKLVGLEVDRETWGDADADNLSLTSPTLTAGPVPHLGLVSPATVAYGQSFTITGTGFAGATAPEVLLNGAADGLQVTGWTDTSITVAVSSPAASGTLEVNVGGTHACELRQLEISSPHCLMKLGETSFHTIAGIPVTLPVWVDMRNGFAPAGGVDLQVMKGTVPVATVTAPAVTRSGGALVTIPPGALTAGQNRFSIRPVGGGFSGADSFFDVFLEVAASGSFLFDGTPQTSVTSTKQGKLWFFLQLSDASGNPLESLPPTVWTSTNPVVCEVHTDPQWGGTELLIHTTGTATITGSTPDGRSYDLPVTVNLPETPVILAWNAQYSTMDNSGVPENKLFAQLDVPMSSTNVGYATGFDLGGSTWGAENKSITWNFVTTPGMAPGTYLFNLTAASLQRSVKVTVVNAPAKGMVTGKVVNLGGGGGEHHMHLMGSLEFYDAGGNKVTPGAGEEDLFISAFGTDTYQAAYLDPGVYRVRWVDEMSGTTQWWPNANTFADASPVTVAAGGATPNINFFLGGTTATSPPTLAGPTTYDAASHTFGIPVQTVEGASYELQRSDSMREGTWFTITEIWGDGNPQTLQDTTATGAKGFYRVLRK